MCPIILRFLWLVAWATRPDQGQANGQGHFEGPPQECSWLDHSLSLQNVPRYQPIAAILDCKPIPSKNVGHRGNINAPVSPFFPFLLSYPSPPITFFLSFIRSRTLAHAAWPTWPRIGPVYSSAFRPMWYAADLRRLNFTIFYACFSKFTLQLFLAIFRLYRHLYFVIALAMRADVVRTYSLCPYYKRKVSLHKIEDLKNTFSKLRT